MGAKNISVPLPAGMSEEQALALYGTWVKQRVTGAAQGKAVAAATKALIGKDGKYRAEFDALVAKNLKTSPR